MNLLHPFLLLFALSAAAATASPQEVQSKAPTCRPQYSYIPQLFEFDWVTNCIRNCPTFTYFPLTSPRGLGRTFTGNIIGPNTMLKPLVFENVHNWQIINCQFSNSPFNTTCGNSTKALINFPSASRKRRPRIGTTEFPGSYAVFAMKSFTAHVPGAATRCSKGCVLNMVGIKTNGKTVVYKQDIVVDADDRTRTRVSFIDKGFTELTALDVWVTNNRDEQPFSIDNFAFDEMIPLPSAAACTSSTLTPSPTGIKGPCTPRPTATSTFTVDLDDITFSTTTFQGPPEVPTTIGLWAPTPFPSAKPYKSLYWSTSFSASTRKNLDGTEVHPELAGVTVPSGKNFIFVRGFGGPRELVQANSYDERFGVTGLWVLCVFPTEGEDVGKECIITFYGVRDPFDGTGYPEKVKATKKISVPGAAGNRFVYVDLSALTTSPGGFTRLSYFFLTATVGTDERRPYFLDSLVFTRELGEGTACRVRGSKTYNFDSYTVASTPLPFPSTALPPFHLSTPLFITSQSLYPPTHPGFIASTSPPNALYAPDPLTFDTYPSTGNTNSLPSPPLFDIDSFDLTFNATSLQLPRITVIISFTDSCGQSFENTIAGYYNRYIMPNTVQYKFAAPIKAVSKVVISVYDGGESGWEYTPVEFWVDNAVGRWSAERARACMGCGVRWSQWCEVPGLVRVGTY